MIDYHRIGPADFAALAAGRGGAAAVRTLTQAQLSKHLLLLKFICQAWPGRPGHRDAAVTALAAAQARDAGVVAELVGDPMTGAWTAATTRLLRTSAVPDGSVDADLGYLGALAAAAAVRTGIDAELTGYARAGRVTLPGLGEAVLPEPVDGPVAMAVSGGRARLSSGAGSVVVPVAGPAWLPLRRLAARRGELSCSVGLEEGNPYRDCYHAPAARRLPADEVRLWQELFTGAWDLLCRFLPERAGELAAGLRSLVPLVDDGTGGARSGTARDAVGTLGLTRPKSAVDLVITLVHEFQHSKLSGLLDLCALYEPDGTERHFAPWRTDPRPTAGLIQGVYAFLGVAEAWCRLRRSARLRDQAEQEFANVREQVRAGLAALEGSAELTRTGRHFTAGMRGALDELLAEPVSAPAARDARAELARRHAIWMHNLGRPTSQHR